MPYTERVVKDRKAVCRLRYNMRKFLEAAERSCREEDYKVISEEAAKFIVVVEMTRDYYDDGKPIPACTCIELPARYCDYCGH